MAKQTQCVTFRPVEEFEGFILHYNDTSATNYASRRQTVARWRYVYQERKKGTSLQAVADKYGITRERVRQIQNDLKQRMDVFYAKHTLL
jgi:DNA-directed RNA polymerase sigma subunit (sigma70/sigma32)